jgi:hypothetical protein
MTNDQFPMTKGQPRTQVKNRARPSGDAAEVEARLFDTAARLELSAADRADQAPLLKRLAEIAAITDDAAWLEAVRRLDAELPSLFAQVLAAGGKAETFHAIYGTAFVDGLIQGAEARPADPIAT